MTETSIRYVRFFSFVALHKVAEEQHGPMRNGEWELTRITTTKMMVGERAVATTVSIHDHYPGRRGVLQVFPGGRSSGTPLLSQKWSLVNVAPEPGTTWAAEYGSWMLHIGRVRMSVVLSVALSISVALAARDILS